MSASLAFSLLRIGANDIIGKWILGYGTKLVWNSCRSTFIAPSNLNDAVIAETTCASRRFKFVKFGLSSFNLLWKNKILLYKVPFYQNIN